MLKWILILSGCLALVVCVLSTWVGVAFLRTCPDRNMGLQQLQIAVASAVILALTVIRLRRLK